MKIINKKSEAIRELMTLFRDELEEIAEEHDEYSALLLDVLDEFNDYGIDQAEFEVLAIYNAATYDKDEKLRLICVDLLSRINGFKTAVEEIFNG